MVDAAEATTASSTPKPKAVLCGIAAVSSVKDIDVDTIIESLQSWDLGVSLDYVVQDEIASFFSSKATSLYKAADKEASASVLHGEARARRRTQENMVQQLKEE